MAGAIPSTMSSKEQLKFRRAGGLDKKYNQELVAVLTDDLSTASNHLAVTAESISFTAGAAGTTGVVIVDKAPVYNADGGKIGHKDDTSFAWVTGTVLTTEVDYDSSLTDAAFLLTLANGEFAVDYLLGRIFYKKATTGTTDTCNYGTRQLNVEVTSSGVGNDVNLKQVAGTTTVTGGVNGLLAVAGNIAHDTADAGNPVKVGGKASTASPAAVADGDRVNAYFDEYGRLHTFDESGSFTDDSAFTPGTSKVTPMGAMADEVAPDSVDEGDAGILRMTLDRKLIGASDFKEDTAHTTGDYGSQVLGVRVDTPEALAGAEGDYNPLQMSVHGCANVDAQHYAMIDDFNATTGWTVLGNDTANLATTTNHVYGTAALTFDKVDGAANTIFAGIQKTITAFNINHYIEESNGFFLGSIYVPDLTNVAYVFFRAGTDSSNYNEWRVEDSSLTAAKWLSVRELITAPHAYAGNGWNSGAVTWVSVGVAFDVETDALAGLIFDAVSVNSGLQVSADITSETTVNSPNVNLLRVAGTAAGVAGAGNVAAGTQRVTIATDDVNLATIAGDTTSLDGKVTACNTGAVVISSGAVTETNSAAIKTAVELIDNAIAGTEMQVDVVAALPAGTNAIGKLAANSGVDIGDVDVLTLPSSIQGAGNPVIDSYAHISINLTTGADQVLVASAANKQIWVYGYGLTCGDEAGQTVSLQDEDDAAVTGIMEFAQYGGISVPPSGNFSMPIFKLGTDKDLEVDITGGDVDGFLCYALVSV